jgi:hypothetical protein
VLGQSRIPLTRCPTILGEDMLATENRTRSLIKRILAIALPVVGRRIQRIRARVLAVLLRGDLVRPSSPRMVTGQPSTADLIRGMSWIYAEKTACQSRDHNYSRITSKQEEIPTLSVADDSFRMQNGMLTRCFKNAL